MTADEPVAGVPRLCARRADCTRPRGYDDECGPHPHVARRETAVVSTSGFGPSTVEQILEQRDALQRQVDAMPATVLANQANNVGAAIRSGVLDGTNPVAVAAAIRATTPEEFAAACALDAVEPADQPHPTPEAWVVYEHEQGRPYTCIPATREIAEREAELAGQGHTAEPADRAEAMRNAWCHGRMAGHREEKRQRKAKS